MSGSRSKVLTHSGQAVFRRLKDAEILSPNDRLRSRFGGKLLEYSLNVSLDRLWPDAQFPCNFLVGLPRGDEVIVATGMCI